VPHVTAPYIWAYTAVMGQRLGLGTDLDTGFGADAGLYTAAGGFDERLMAESGSKSG